MSGASLVPLCSHREQQTGGSGPAGVKEPIRLRFPLTWGRLVEPQPGSISPGQTRSPPLPPGRGACA